MEHGAGNRSKERTPSGNGGSSPHDRPSVPEVIAYARRYYNSERGKWVGGSLHIVLDDGNLSNDSVDFCIDHAKETDDEAGWILATMIRSLTSTQRRSLYRKYDEYCTRPTMREVIMGVEG